MTLDRFRRQMDTYRRAADEEANSVKDSHLAPDRLYGLYGKFDSKERTMADRVLAEWVVSNDEAARFDALALIDEFGIVSAAALKPLAVRLASSEAPGAPFELNKVNRIIASLAS